jgi:toxin ParE1/3/4
VPTEELALHEEAGAEYDAAFDWYLEHSPDAALKFDSEVNRAFVEIARAPQRWAIGPYQTRRFLVRKFPFVLIYRERTGGDIQIVAVAHTSRKPRYWKERI